MSTQAYIPTGQHSTPIPLRPLKNPHRLNAEESARLSALLTAAGLESPAHVCVLRALWERGRGDARIDATYPQIAEQAGKSERWVEDNLPFALEALKASGVELVRLISRGQKGRPSTYSTRVLRECFDELNAAAPVSVEAYPVIAREIVSRRKVAMPEASPPQPNRKRPMPLPVPGYIAEQAAIRLVERVSAARAKAGLLLRDELNALLRGAGPIMNRIEELELEVAQQEAGARELLGLENFQPTKNVGCDAPMSPENRGLKNGNDPRECGEIAPSSDEEEDLEGEGIVAQPDELQREPDSTEAVELVTQPLQPSRSEVAPRHSRWNPEHNSENLNRRLEELVQARGVNKLGFMHCPLHEDRTASCKVTRKGGKVLLRCHSGSCGRSGKDILDWLDGGVVPHVVPEQSAPAREARRSGRMTRLEAEHTYRDEHGEPTYRVQRGRSEEGNKTFRTGRHVGGGRFDYSSDNMRGVSRILYRLPELLAADPGSLVYFVEGEKAADELARRGLVVTSPGGANRWTPSTMVESLRGRHVVVLPDHDEAGRKLADQIVSSLHGVAASVTVVELPELGAKEDVFDWLTVHGHDVDDLVEEAQRRGGHTRT